MHNASAVLLPQRSKLFALRNRARNRRAQIFRRLLVPGPETTILDLGGGGGDHIAGVLPRHDPSRVTVADITPNALEAARTRYGFNTVLLDERAPALPFDRRAFDVLFCSSVIEHVTVPKDEVYACRSTQAFQAQARANQLAFANEIRRVCRRYFVQTPYKYFAVESHSLLPMPVVLLPRPLQIATLGYARKLWIKRTRPDFLLFDRRQMQAMFPDADIHRERWFGLTKSLMAVRTLAPSLMFFAPFASWS
jgi:ubiquinone/menaquinone biosynthesis C-methylase UbiE